MWGVVALTVATFTVLLAVRRVVMVVSGLVFARYVAVGGLAAFSVDRDDAATDTYRVRFEAGGPAVFHNVTVQLFGVPESAAPEPPAGRRVRVECWRRRRAGTLRAVAQPVGRGWTRTWASDMPG